MKKPCLLCYLLLAFTLWVGAAKAQTGQADMLDSIIKKMGYYARRQPAGLMFVHLDKTVYVGNENIWFTAYLINCPPAELARHQVLSALLVNDADNSISTAEKFISAGKLAFGNLSLPDSIAPGNYTFIAYTNHKINGKPAAFFAQPITVKTAAQPQFNLVARVDTTVKDAAGFHVTLKGSTSNGALQGATVSYALGTDKKKRVNGRGKTDSTGHFQIVVPRNRISGDQHILDITVKKGEEVKSVKLFMPLARTAHQLKFYPEGGYLVTGISNIVAWEAKNAGGAPLKATALLFAGSQVIDTIVTNSYGMGTFILNPLANVKYRVKLLAPFNKDTTYALPAAVQTGVAMHVVNAIVNDTLRFGIQSLKPQTIYLVVQNYNQVYATMPVHMPVGRRPVSIDLTHIPRGLVAISLLDSLHRPIAERLFFAHHQEQNKVTIKTSSQVYGVRKKVNLSLRLNNKNGKPIEGIVSVACVQDNRFDIKKDNNIENYVYLQSALDNLPLKEKYLAGGNLDLEYLNQLLLVRGWSRYKWVDMEKARATDTLQKQDSLMFTAKLNRIGRKIKKPQQLLVMHDSSRVFEILKSDEQGNVSIDNINMAARYGKKVRLIVNGESSEYVIDVTDPYKQQNLEFAAAHQSAYFGEPPAEIDTRDMVLKGMERATQLREVKIVARKDYSLYRRGPGLNANRCGDYVCRFQILNCANHVSDPENHPPHAGEMVHISGMGLTAYLGCSDDDTKAGMVAVKGIYEAQEFYGADYSVINPTEPDFLSTICWKHAVGVSSEKDTQLSFYTSDITGAYRIVVQGITGEDVLYSQSLINVKK